MISKIQKNISKVFKNSFKASLLYGFVLTKQVKIKKSAIFSDFWPGDLNAGQNLVEGLLKVGNHFVPLKQMLYFLANSHDCSPNFLLYLHSFEWLRDLRALSTNSSRKRARELILYWINNNRSWTKKSWTTPAWQRHITGQRVRNWIGFYEFFGASADESFREVFWASLSKQINHLSYNCTMTTPNSFEYIQALTGTFFASYILENNNRELKLNLQNLERSLQLQINEEGGHKSRSTVVQYLLLKDLIDIRSILRQVPDCNFEYIQKYIQKIAPVLRFFRHTNGELATFFGDKKFKNFESINYFRPSSESVDMVLSLSDTKTRAAINCKETGYEKITTKGGVVIFNTKPSLFRPCFLELESDDLFADSKDKPLGVLDSEWSTAQLGLFCIKDVVFHDNNGNNLLINNTHENKIQLNWAKRQKEGCQHLWARLNYKQSNYKIIYEKEFYLAANTQDFRGVENINLNQEGLVGISFAFGGAAEVVSEYSHSVKIVINEGNSFSKKRINNNPLGQTNKRYCKIIASGVDQIVTTRLPGGSLYVVLMALLKPLETKVIKWSIQL